MPLIDVTRLTEDLLLDTAPGAPAPTTPATTATAPPPLPGSPVRALDSRTAVRHWAPEPLDRRVLCRALAHASLTDACLWASGGAPATAAPTALVLVRDVGGTRPGVHAYDPGSGELVAEPGPLPDLRDLVLQLEFARAPAIVVVLGDLVAATERAGAAGHRQLLTRGAAFAHSAWLSALSEGAAGTVFAGVLGAAGRTTLGFDGARRAQLIALALGNPTREEGR
ncbi:hypothetical protein ABT160_16045 [Streptomyces sp. NPDC001941]|uniref:hypothetical protein n=1 Tax=Streptomyces sp. NPDC001941 TaxID=3154659 RepID=UPI00331B7DFB